jgi:ribose transport system ATP-binding protein
VPVSGITELETPRLLVESACKNYGRIRALDNVLFELRPGEVMALLGENGAGKSTLVKVLSGLVKLDRGQVAIDGRSLDLTDPARSQLAGVAVVQQELTAIKCLTVAENLAIGQRGTPFVWRPRRLAQQARPLLERVGLGHIDPSTPMEHLSVAEMQLVEIARILARDARIIIFDEPTAALSDVEIERVLTIVRLLASEGRSIVYVTHRLDEVFQIADRVTVLRNGCSQMAENVEDLTVDAIVAKMIGRELESMFPARGTPFSVVLRVHDLMAPGLAEPVSFALQSGEILGLTGQIGSGARLVLHALAGVVPGSVASISLDGRPVDLRNRAAGLRAGVAYCSDDRKRNGIFANLSVTKNLSSPWLNSVASHGVIVRRHEDSKARDVASTMALSSDRLGLDTSALSGGNQQKVALGKWIGTGAKVLLVEEPTRGVDVGARAEIYAKMRALCNEGMAIVVCSSDTSEIMGLCDSIASFYRGRMTKMMPYQDWDDASLLSAVMHADEVVAP